MFAGTYRTALGLSRTFILPDSPRSLELQLQGDDLVELFLVFAQNVFGLEPATVRVREIRIGRAERRAARRRARENRQAGRGDIANDAEPEEETNVGVSIGVSVPAASNARSSPLLERPESPALFSQDHPEEGRAATPEPMAASISGQSEELLLMTTTQMGPYTTFQQLNFAPRFPLASIADEYIIPPTYPSVLETKARQELNNKNEDLPVETQERAQFTPPGLPVPTLSAPSRWFYRDPKNIVHGESIPFMPTAHLNGYQGHGRRRSCRPGIKMPCSHLSFLSGAKKIRCSFCYGTLDFDVSIQPNLSVISLLRQGLRPIPGQNNRCFHLFRF